MLEKRHHRRKARDLDSVPAHLGSGSKGDRCRRARHLNGEDTAGLTPKF